MRKRMEGSEEVDKKRHGLTEKEKGNRKRKERGRGRGNRKKR